MSGNHPSEDVPNGGTNRSRWQFLLTPWWIVGHIVVLVAVVLFINLGFWQLDRLDERREYNAAFASQMEQEPVGLQEIEPLLAEGESAAAFRRVEVSGEFDEDQEVLLSTRSMDGTPGHHVLTPFETEGYGTVLVDRGWVPLDMGAEPPPVEAADPPEGELLVTGVLFPSIEAQNSGSQDGQTDDLEFMSEVDVERFAIEQNGPVFPLYVLAQDVEGADAESFPVPGELPETDEGSHFPYAVQWMIFATVVAIGYPILLRHRSKGSDTPADEAGTTTGDASEKVSG